MGPKRTLIAAVLIALLVVMGSFALREAIARAFRVSWAFALLRIAMTACKMAGKLVWIVARFVRRVVQRVFLVRSRKIARAKNAKDLREIPCVGLHRVSMVFGMVTKRITIAADRAITNARLCILVSLTAIVAADFAILS